MIYGIDLGTTYSVITDPTTNYISPLVPSVADVDRKIAGDVVKKDFSKWVLRNTKRDISQDYPASLASAVLVLLELKKLVGKEPSDKIQAVISVPAYFNIAKKTATIAAARHANIEVVQLITEPTAASLLLAEEGDITLVYDLGGGTFDVSAVERKNGTISVLTTRGMFLGGSDLDTAIFNFIVRKYGIQEATLPNPKAFIGAMETLKIKRQQTPKEKPAQVYVDGKCVELTAEEYTNIVQKTFRPTLDIILNVLDDLKLKAGQYKLLPVGGSTRCPYLLEYLEQTLGLRLPKRDFNPDEAVARGVMIYADAIMKGTHEELLQLQTPEIFLKLGDIEVPIMGGGVALPAYNPVVLYGSPPENLEIWAHADSIKHLSTLKYNHRDNGSTAFAIEAYVSVDRILKLVIYQTGNERDTHVICL